VSIIENSGAEVIKVAEIYFSVTYFHSLQTIIMARRFDIEDTITRRYTRFNATGTQLTVRLLPPINDDDRDPVSHLLASVIDLFEHA